MNVEVKSEIGVLEGVIIHTPGSEVENMTPQNAERALYSDILNLKVAGEEYDQFKGILKKVTNVYEVKDLLYDVLQNGEARKELLDGICRNENVQKLRPHLESLPLKTLANQLIEGVPIVKNNLTNFLSEDRYSLRPLHNFFFTRDSSITVNNHVFIAKMASKVREREALIMDTIFGYHKELRTETFNPATNWRVDSDILFEGGDILVAREDVLCVGTGARSSTQGVDYILDTIKELNGGTKHILVQELPHSPESFIHLDMVFTFIDHDKVMIYEPVICNQHAYQTVHITIDNGEVKSISEEENLILALNKLGMPVEAVKCGGDDEWTQEREQWHSGANFFAMGPGRVIGYGRNNKTIEELNKKGLEVLEAWDVLENNIDLNNYEKYIVTIDGAELARGGGGCRCMTMPVKRR